MDAKAVERRLRTIGELIEELENNHNIYTIARVERDNGICARTIELLGMITGLKELANYTRIMAELLADSQEAEKKRAKKGCPEKGWHEKECPEKEWHEKECPDAIDNST